MLRNLPVIRTIMNISLVKVESSSDIATIVALAREIWHQHFTPIIGTPQVEYMLEKFQSVEAISTQLETGMEYYIATLDKKPVGYTGLLPDIENNTMMISKIYLRENNRRAGIGTHLLNFIENECKDRELGKIWLTVNRFNHAPIEWYSKKGFKTVDEVKMDIGNGFFMDDYIMEKQL